VKGQQPSKTPTKRDVRDGRAALLQKGVERGSPSSAPSEPGEDPEVPLRRLVTSPSPRVLKPRVDMARRCIGFQNCNVGPQSSLSPGTLWLSQDERPEAKDVQFDEGYAQRLSKTVTQELCGDPADPRRICDPEFEER
jgi:hypothetical protein